MNNRPAALGQADDFPLLRHHAELAYWDNAATTQKPQQVLDALVDFYSTANAPAAHRSAYRLGHRASQLYEETRRHVARFCGWNEAVIFGHGCTEAINLVANGFLAPRLRRGQRVLISVAEHHANFLPWQRVCRQHGAELVLLPIDGQGELVLDQFDQQLGNNCAMLALSHVSNVLGTINPIAELCARARHYGVPVLIDGAQAVGHLPLDLSEVDCDFYCFSSHKMYAADGCGVLLAKNEHLEQIEPLNLGGGIVEYVSPTRTTLLSGPQRFEAGTMPVAAIATLPTAIAYLDRLERERIAAHEDQLRQQCEQLLTRQAGLTIYGRAADKVAVTSFSLAGVHAHDIATVFDDFGLAVRAGHHCAQPLMQALGQTALVRISFGLYNSLDQLQQRLPPALATLRRLFL